jgi:hypothetical protein
MSEAVLAPDHSCKSSVRGRTDLNGRRKTAQLLDLQAELFFACLDPETEIRDKAALACAWERLENRLGRMRMRPEPKPVDVSAKSRKSDPLTDFQPGK